MTKPRKQQISLDATPYLSLLLRPFIIPPVTAFGMSPWGGSNVER